MVEMELDREALKAHIQAKMYELLDAKTREQLIRDALKSLTERTTYGTRETPIELAFSGAVRRYANDVVCEWFDGHQEVRDIIRDLCEQACIKLMNEPGGALHQAVADAVATALRDAL